MIGRLDHVNLRTARLDEMTRWYGEVLGLRSGWRPPSFGFPGAWLYAGEDALVHLVGVEVTAPPHPDAQLEHAAFSATGLTAFLEKLEARGERHRLSALPDAGLVQVNVWDPDGNHLHIDFPYAEAEAGGHLG